MWTREDYLEKRCTHREYWAQYVNERAKDTLKHILLDKILASQDECFNDISLKVWDDISVYYKEHVCRVNKTLGNGYTYASSDGVCMLKEAARQIKEEHDEAN